MHEHGILPRTDSPSPPPREIIVDPQPADPAEEALPLPLPLAHPWTDVQLKAASAGFPDFNLNLDVDGEASKNEDHQRRQWEQEQKQLRNRGLHWGKPKLPKRPNLYLRGKNPDRMVFSAQPIPPVANHVPSPPHPTLTLPPISTSAETPIPDPTSISDPPTPIPTSMPQPVVLPTPEPAQVFHVPPPPNSAALSEPEQHHRDPGRSDLQRPQREDHSHQDDGPLQHHHHPSAPFYEDPQTRARLQDLRAAAPSRPEKGLGDERGLEDTLGASTESWEDPSDDNGAGR